MNISRKEIIKSVQISTTSKELWRLWTRRDGLNSFFGEDSKVDLRIGGAFEIYFLLDNPYGMRGSEGCKILSYLPERMLSFTWNAPPQFSDIRNSSYHTWVVVDFYMRPEQIEVTLTHTGWPVDIEWQPVFDYFEDAWGRVLSNLQMQAESS